jgi:drug/metabolite transporter (DMT)-like permease
MKSNTFKGYFFALIATLAFSNVYIFSKAALNEVHLIQFGVYWFSISTVLNFLYALFTNNLSQTKYLHRRQFMVLLTLGLLEILTTGTFFISVNIIPDPAVTSFLGNLYPVILALGGVIVLNEKFGPLETIGAAIAITGAFIISYTGETSLKKIFIPGTGVILLNAIFATSASLIVKVHVKKISPELINLNRSVWLLVFSVIMMVILRQSPGIPLSAVKNIAIGAVLGPFISILTVYYSFKYIEASRSSIVQSLKGIFVLAGAYLFFGTLPEKHQLAGGALTILGVLLMTLARADIIKKKQAF